MAKPPDMFQKTPRRVTPKGRRVVVSAEAKAAYEAMIREKDERQKIEQHLPPDMKR